MRPENTPQEKGDLLIIRGPPGSGKSSFANSTKFVAHFEADMWFELAGGFDPLKLPTAHVWCLEQTQIPLMEGFDTVVSNTFTELWEIEPYLEFARKNSIRYTVIKMETLWNSIHDVPVEKIHEMIENYEVFSPPTL